MTAAGDTRSYGGLLTALPFAFRRSNSTVFRVYLLLGGFVGLFVTLIFGLGTLVLLDSMAGVAAGVITFTPALYLLIWLAIVAPLLTPPLLVARRHRLGNPSRRYDCWIAVAGFCFVGLLYCGAVIALPSTQQPPIQPGPFAGLLRQFYAWAQPIGVVPPLIGVGAIIATHWLFRDDERTLE